MTVFLLETGVWQSPLVLVLDIGFDSHARRKRRRLSWRNWRENPLANPSTESWQADPILFMDLVLCTPFVSMPFRA